MLQIRKNVFETNSSMTHSLVLCSKEQYDKWGDELLFHPYKEQFVNIEEGRKLNAEHLRSMLTSEYSKSRCEQFGINENTIKDYENDKTQLSDFTGLLDRYTDFYLTPEEWTTYILSDNGYEELYAANTFGGVDVVAFGYHGYNG